MTEALISGMQKAHTSSKIPPTASEIPSAGITPNITAAELTEAATLTSASKRRLILVNKTNCGSARNIIKIKPIASATKSNDKKMRTSIPTKLEHSILSNPRVSVNSYPQQVSGSLNVSSPIEILSKGITPRPPLLDASNRRDFEERWNADYYGMHLEHLIGYPDSAYLKAIYQIIPKEDLFSFGLVEGFVEIYTTNHESAKKLMIEGIELDGRYLGPFPIGEKPTRVIFSRVPIRAANEDLLCFLKVFGQTYGKVRAIPLNVDDESLGRVIFSTSRETLITLNQGTSLPSGFFLNIAELKYWIEVSIEDKCNASDSVGHLLTECPKIKTSEDNVSLKEVSAPAVPVEMKTSSNTLTALIMQAQKQMTSSDKGFTAETQEHTRILSRKSKVNPVTTPSHECSEITPKRPHAHVGCNSCTSKVESKTTTVTSEFSSKSYPHKKQILNVLNKVHHKKDPNKIRKILRKEVGDPKLFLLKLEYIQKEFQEQKKQSEAGRCARLSSKIKMLFQKRLLSGASLQ